MHFKAIALEKKSQQAIFKRALPIFAVLKMGTTMHLKLTFWKTTLLLLVSLVFIAGSCKKQAENKLNEIPQEFTDKREMPKSLPEPGPEEIEQKQLTINLMQELAAQLSAQSDMTMMAELISRLQDKNLLSNIQKQRYRLLAPTNAAFKTLPERELGMLTDASGNNQGYQMKFFIHHMCPSPNNPYPGFAYHLLAGQEVKFTSDSLEVGSLKRKASFSSMGTIAAKVDVLKISHPLFY